MNSSHHILVVEDSKTQAMKLQFILEAEGWTVTCAVSAEEALKEIGQKPPNLIIADYHLPGIRGDELCRQIRMQISTRSIPILMLTSDQNQGAELHGLESGADDYISKSVDPDILLLRIRALLRKSQLQSTVVESQETSFKQARILAIDDSPTYLEFLLQELREDGYLVEGASNGRDGLERIRREHFDCVLVDLMMPGVDGIEVCRRLSHMRHSMDDPLVVLMLTASESKEDMTLGLEAGADDFVGKSSHKAVLKGRIRALLRRKFFQQENRRIHEELKNKELEAVQARAEKLAAGALRESEKRFRTLADTAPVMMWMSGVDMRCTFFSKPWLDFTGRTLEEEMGDGWVEGVHPEDRKKSLFSYRVAFEKRENLIMEFRLRRADGEYRWILDTAVPRYEPNGDFAGYIGSCIDISVRKEMETELERARDAASESARIKAEFLANMSHEIRTPMNGVIGMTGLLMDTPLNDEQKRFVETIQFSGEGLLAIINDILDFSKIEAGKLEFETVDFNLQTSVEGAMELLHRQAQNKEIELLGMVESDVPHLLRGDPSRLRQVLTNFLSNAIKFTVNGEVVLAVSKKEETDLEATLRFEVRDTGIGISRETLKDLFQPFTQADASTTRKFGGTGLGLAISKKLVEIARGKIGATSVLGKGSVFWCEIPFAKQKKAEFPANPADLAKEELLSGVRVLVVDDNSTNRKIFSQQLEAWGIRSSMICSGGEALESLRCEARAGDPFDVAIIDVRMPDMDGFMLSRAVRADRKIADTKLMLMSFANQKGNIPEMEKLGIAEHLTKPVKKQLLQEGLCRLLGIPMGESGEIPAEKKDAAPSVPFSLNILIVEDNEVNQEVVTRQLRKMGCSVELAVNGSEALAMLLNHSYDIVFMDCQMPEMDGYEATRELRRREKGADRHQTVIAMTAHALHNDREKCLASGMDDYISKPVRMQELFRILDAKQEEIISAKAAEPEAEIPLEEEPVDMEILCEAAPEEDERKEIIQLYMRQTREMIHRLGTGIKTENFASVQSLSHKCAGSSAACGMTALVPVLLDLEEMGVKQSLEGAPRLFSRLEAEFERSQTFLQARGLL